MTRLIFHRAGLMCFLLFLVTAGRPALACFNDTSIDRSEQEFRSQYAAVPETGGRVPDVEPAGNRDGTLIFILGTSLIAVSGYFGFKQWKKGDNP